MSLRSNMNITSVNKAMHGTLEVPLVTGLCTHVEPINEFLSTDGMNVQSLSCVYNDVYEVWKLVWNWFFVTNGVDCWNSTNFNIWFCSYAWQSFFGFGQGAEVEIVLDGQEARKMAEIKTEDGKKEKHYLYLDGETISGKVHCPSLFCNWTFSKIGNINIPDVEANISFQLTCDDLCLFE